MPYSANAYQAEESEEWIGEWMEKRGVRDQMVIATKYTTGYRTAHHGKEIQSNFVGNSAKSLHVSLEASLKKLKTSYIDLFYVHWYVFIPSDRQRLAVSSIEPRRIADIYQIGGTSLPVSRKSCNR